MKTVFKISFLFCLYLFGSIETQGQFLSSTNKAENITFFTDRTLYIAGEKIQFASYLFINDRTSLLPSYEGSQDWKTKGEKVKRSGISKIINVELITPNGERILEYKYIVNNSLSSGCLKIPNDIKTGVYYLRAYTKFMRNDGPTTYAYVPLKIINPFKSDVLNYSQLNIASKDSGILNEQNKSQDILSITFDKKIYSTRERIVFSINRNNIKDNVLRGLTLSVIPEFSYSNNYKVNPIVEEYINGQYYYPETRGLSLSGELKDSKSEKKYPNTLVNLSVLGDSKDFMAVNTDSTGRFFFKIPHFIGVKKIFLCTESFVDSKSTILIDKDFCQYKVNIPSPSFQLDEKERVVAFNLALNNQIASYFKSEIHSDSVNYGYLAFYDEPQIKLELMSYIQLPTIEDYINELIPMLKIKTHHREKKFRILSDQEEMNIYEPLVLVDMVAIDNPEKILALPPQKIDRIEIVSTPYIKGEIIYGGIISFFSKKGDFADIDLPSSGVLLDYKFLSDCTCSEEKFNLKLNQPDTRNTLLWLPNIEINSNAEEFSFKTSDTPGKYLLMLRGVTDKGKEIIYKSSFEVREQLK